VDKFLELLTKLAPAGVAVAIVAFLYLVALFKRASDRFIELGHKQAEFLQDRIEVIDKTSVIFTRAIEQQEKEILKLKGELESVSMNLAQTRTVLTDRSVEEVRAIGDAVRQVLSIQQQTLGYIATRAAAVIDSPSSSALVKLNQDASESLDVEVEELLRRRDLSRYPVQAASLEGAEGLVAELKSLGLAASVWKSLGPDEDLISADHEAIWVGRSVPPVIVSTAITIARRHWPFLRYVFVSGDRGDEPPPDIHFQLFLGGATKTAKQTFGLRGWQDAEIALLSAIKTIAELHQAIRTHYPPEPGS
jgi:hypothetical protein